MRLLPVDNELREVWKTFPVRFEGPKLSRCCNWPTVLVQSMDGGFVTSNCAKCGKHTTLTNHDFLESTKIWVACPECGLPMQRDIVFKNYSFVCEPCDVAIRLADILPKWQDVQPISSL